MYNNLGKSTFYSSDDYKNKLIFLAVLLGANFLIINEPLIYWATTFFFIFSSILYKDVGYRINEFFYVQKYYIPKLLAASVMGGMFFTFAFRYTTYNSQNLYLITMIAGGVFMIISLIMIVKSREIKIFKRDKDFPNLKQEQVYDEIDSLDVFNKYRVKEEIKYKTIVEKHFFGLIKKEKKIKDGKRKIVDYSHIDLNVTDDKDKKILPHVKKEIIDIINQENQDFYTYSLTVLKNENEADELIAKLELDEIKMIKPRHRRQGIKYEDGFRFPRFWYQMIQKNLKSISNETNKIEYDFKKGLVKFDGVFEYVMIDMYIFQANYFNRPIGNSKALALLDDIYNGNKNMLELCGAMDSSIFISIKRRGVAYLAGYLLALKKKNLSTPSVNKAA